MMIVALALAIGVPMTRRALVRAEMMGQVKMLQTAIAVCRMRAITEGQWVIVELLEKQDGAPHETPPGGLIQAWVDTNQNRRLNTGETVFGEWYLNMQTAVLKEGGNRRMRDLRQGYKGVVFYPSGMADATKDAGPGIGRGSVIVEDAFGNQIRLQIWSSTATVQLTMKVPGTNQWDSNLRHWTY